MDYPHFLVVHTPSFFVNLRLEEKEKNINKLPSYLKIFTK